MDGFCLQDVLERKRKITQLADDNHLFSYQAYLFLIISGITIKVNKKTIGK